MYCKNCNQSYSDEHVFCNNCGTKLENTDNTVEAHSVESTTIDVPVEEASQSFPQQEPATDTEPVLDSEQVIESESIQDTAINQDMESKKETVPLSSPASKPNLEVQAQPTQSKAKLQTPQPKPAQPPVNPTPQTNLGAAPIQPAVQHPQPTAVPSETIDKKLSKTVPFLGWIGLILLNIVPFIIGVIGTIAMIAVPFFFLDTFLEQPLSLILPGLSLIYIILLFIWAFAKPKARSLKNYSRATLLMSAIVIVLFTVAYFVFKENIQEIMEMIKHGEFISL